jgi:serine/threonine protein kinase/cytochrome c-type biogenesis protein CcmH/NrfG
MAVPDKLNGRYEIKEVLGQGGMGLVFRAWDATVKRDVALKTLRDAPTRAALQMFQKECGVLAAMSHPNIIEIFDIGEFEDDGTSKPYFVMPLLPGSTLDQLIKAASHRLTVERVVDMVCQVCRGLQAAHERGLVHRDIKPSNIFVMDDDSVKIIDFGVAHMAETGLSVGIKGTLLYMAPEQLQMKPATPASDIYSLGVVCYETLTRRRPFEGGKEAEIADAILRIVPPPICDLNPAASQTLSRVIHKALAKQPWNRYASAKEFADTLQKGLRNEPIEFFDPERLRPRIERATKAFEQGDLQFAAEILNELEAEGHIDPAITPLKRQIESAGKQKTIAQLLQSARTRFENDEYPLSLQKIQEILQLDPGNAPALGLKASIENKMISRKIEDWFRLAQEHLDNQAWSHAREALHNVLQLRANETRAVQLMAEVDRLEQEYMRLRKEKEELYHSALEAWNAGEVTTALSKMEKVVELDHKAPETAAPDRAASYQTFYNKVRSEHDSIKSSYAEAKKLLEDRSFVQALAIADEWLTKYPGHALFQALKFDIEEQRRQELSSKIAEIDRQVEAEPDLDRRVGILEQAVAQHPGEPHFERQLRPMREKRDLVNSIAAKARYHEERGQFADALTQWEILNTIYSQYPGLAFETERVQKKKEQQALSEAKSRWTSQIDAAMTAGDFARSLSLCEAAETEFPNDPELEQLKQLAADSSARAEEAAQLLVRGQTLSRENSFDEGLGTMRQALELNPRSQTIRTAIVEALVERARALVDTDWRAAEPLIQQALEIDPAHLLAKNLRIIAQDHKRDEAVNSCFTKARQFRAAGDLENALAEAEKCLAAYPLDPRLAQLRDILAKELGEGRRAKTRPPDLETLRQLEQQAAAAGSAAEAGAALDQARALAGAYAGDPEFEQIVHGMEQRLTEMAGAAPAAPDMGIEATATSIGVPQQPLSFEEMPTAAMQVPPPLPPPAGEVPPAVAAGHIPTTAEPSSMEGPPPPASSIFAVPVMPPAAEQPPGGPPPMPPGGPPPLPPQAVPPGAPGAGAPQGPPASKRLVSRNGLWMGAGAVGAMLVLVAAILIIPKLLRKAPPPVTTVRVEVRTWPPGAVIRVNGKIRGTSNFELEDKPGSYQIDAALDGYQPASATAQLKLGMTAPVELTLQPLPQTVRLITDFNDAKVTLDDQEPKAPQDGQVNFDAVKPGKHTIRLTSRLGQAQFDFELIPGAVPRLGGPPEVKNTTGLMVSSFGSQAHVYTTLSAASVALDGAPVGEAGPDGLQLTNLTPGTHELTVASGQTQVKRVIDVGAAPELSAFFQSDQNVGTIVVVTGEDGVDVYVDGRKYRHQTSRGGQLRIQRTPKEYHIRVAKQGFEEVPEQTIQIAKGEEKRLVFQMVPLPTTARLTLRGTPGAEVLIDQNPAGTLLPDGTFQISNLSPGEHVIELRKDRQRSRPIRRTFTAGQTVSVSDNEVALRGGNGTLRVSVSPANATVTVGRDGRAPQPLTGNTMELEEGTYTVAARAPGYTEHSQQVQVTGGQVATVTLTLAKEQRKVVAMGMEGWEQPDAWKQEEGWWVRHGGGYVLYGAADKPGTYEFTLMAASGGLLRGKNLQWFAGYTDSKNYVLFRMDKDNLHRYECVNGKRSELYKKSHGLKFKDMVATIRVEVAPGLVVTRVLRDNHWVVLDSWSAPSHNFAEGRFGILVEGNDEVRLSGFQFIPRE